MKHIEIHGAISIRNYSKVHEMYVYRPDNPEDDKVLESLGWERKDLYDEDYFYHTTFDETANKAVDKLSLEIKRIRQAPIWKMDYVPKDLKTGE